MCSSASSPDAPRSTSSANSCRGVGRQRVKSLSRKRRPERREDASVRRQRLGNLLRLAGVGKDFISDDAQRYFMKIGPQGTIKLAELGPKNLIDEAPRRPDHDGVTPLPMKTIGSQP